MQERYTEGVSKEGRAVVDGCEVACGGHVDCHIPRAASNSQCYRYESCCFQDVGDRRVVRFSSRKMYVSRQDHLGCGADEVDVAPPECFPWSIPS